MSEFKIEKNVPIPARRGGGPPNKYPWRDMEVGDSFFVPANGKSRNALMRALTSSTQSKSLARDGLKFTARTDAEANGVRVWRIK